MPHETPQTSPQVNPLEAQVPFSSSQVIPVPPTQALLAGSHAESNHGEYPPPISQGSMLVKQP